MRIPTDATGAAQMSPAAAEDQEGWLARFYVGERDSLCAYLRRRYGAGPPEPEDVAHQAFTELAQMGEAKVKGLEFPRSFLFRVAENRLIHEKRRARTHARHATVVLAPVEGEESQEVGPEIVLALREDLALIAATIQAMPERRRSCLLLHRMEELSLAEIGRRLKISATAVANHIERAVADIEAALAHDVPLEPFKRRDSSRARASTSHAHAGDASLPPK